MNYEPEMRLKMLAEELEVVARYQEVNKFSLLKDRAAHVAVHLRLISLWIEVKHLAEFLGADLTPLQDPKATRWRFEPFQLPWEESNRLAP